MKKPILSLVVLASFLMGNFSMVATVIKIFGTDALIPVVKDLVGRKVDTLLWGAPQTPSERLAQTAYGPKPMSGGYGPKPMSGGYGPKR